MIQNIQSYIEQGLSSDQIVSKFLESPQEEVQSEIFPEEIQFISKPFAYRQFVAEDDLQNITKVIESSYSAENIGKESFRVGPVVNIDEIKRLIQYENNEYKWLLMEVPDSVEDVAITKEMIIGVCCYCTNGLSKRNGIVEGKLGSIRYFGIVPKYHGLLLGARFLQKVEDKLLQDGCVRIMICVPSPRTSVLSWIERRGYQPVSEVAYPFHGLCHVAKQKTNEQDVHLIQCVKSLSPELDRSSQHPKIEQGHLPPIFRNAMKFNTKNDEVKEDLEGFIPDVD